MGPDGANVPSPDQGLLGKTVSALSDNLAATISGKTMKFTGDLKTLKDQWTEFDPNGNNTGHFVPIQLPTSFVGNSYTMKGRRDGARTVKIDADRLLVVRLENLNTLTPNLEKDGEVAIQFDFTALVPTGEKAYKEAKADFGNYGKRDEMITGFSVTWDGINATVKGQFDPQHTATNLPDPGCHLPIGLDDWYGDGIPKEGGIDNIREFKEQDMVLIVKSTSKPAVFRYCGMDIMKFDISGMTGIEPVRAEKKTRIKKPKA